MAETKDTAKVVKFKKPIHWEDADYTEVDLSGLDKLTVQDAIEAQNMAVSAGNTAAMVLTETSSAFAMEIAHRASGIPIEFFQSLPMAAGRAVRQMVQANFNMEADGSTMKLNEEYKYKGKGYKEIDLSGVADLNTMNAVEAENRLARKGVIASEPSVNYYYCCVVAAMATGLDEEFFTGLPIREASKLKVTVNNTDFFE